MGWVREVGWVGWVGEGKGSIARSARLYTKSGYNLGYNLEVIT